MSTPPLLEITDLTKAFHTQGGHSASRTTVAVDRVSLTLATDQPTILSVVGESGSGKTTLARMVLGLTEPTEGVVRYRGLDIAQMPRTERTRYRREEQAVFQDPYGIYNPFYRIDRVLKLAITKFKLASARAEADALMDKALQEVGLRPADIRGRYPHQLSGGERQRIMLARLYLLRPALIVADEPVTMIDAAVRALFLNILLDFRDTYGMSCLFITHDLSVSYYLGGEIAIMNRGRIVERGSVDTVLAHPAHPYSQALVKALPSSDPKHRWQERVSITPPPEGDDEADANRCLYADRCPSVMPRCWKARPGVYTISPGQQAECFLYDSAGSDSPARSMALAFQPGD